MADSNSDICRIYNLPSIPNKEQQTSFVKARFKINLSYSFICLFLFIHPLSVVMPVRRILCICYVFCSHHFGFFRQLFHSLLNVIADVMSLTTSILFSNVGVRSIFKSFSVLSAVFVSFLSLSNKPVTLGPRNCIHVKNSFVNVILFIVIFINHFKFK